MRAGSGMDEHLTVNRLEDARFLMESGASIEEAARRVGWSQQTLETNLKRYPSEHDPR